MIEYDEMDPFGEKYKQKWSATPYSVRCVNDTHQGAVVAYVYVDGTLACNAVLLERGRNPWLMDFKGFQSNIDTLYTKDSITEFLFTVPRAEVGRRDAPKPPPNPDLGTVVVKFYRAETKGEVTQHENKASAGVHINPVSKAKLKDAKATTATASGAQVQVAAGAYQATSYHLIDKLFPCATFKFHYGSLSQLQFKGIGKRTKEPEAKRAKREAKDAVTVDKNGAICFD